MTDHDLINSIYELHKYYESPITYQRSKYCPVDAIYCSRLVMAHYVGYLALRKLVGDHRGLWMNILQSYLIGFHQNKIIPPLARHIRLYIPHSVRRVKNVLHHIFLNDNVYSCIKPIHELAVYPLPPHHSRSLEIIDTIIVKLMQISDEKYKIKITSRVIWYP